MDRKSIRQLHEKSIEELKSKSQELRQEIAKLRLETSVGRVKDIHQLKNKRHDLSRILTVLREKEVKAELTKK